MRLICDGDSWTFGSEIIDPQLQGKISDWESPNDAYRTQRIWPTYLGQKLQAETVNLSWPADTNDTIISRTIHHLLDRRAAGESLDDTLLIVGWTSPERKDFWYKDEGHASKMQLWPYHRHYTAPAQVEFWKLYTSYFNNPEEYLHRWSLQLLQLQTFCAMYGVHWVCFSAFYQMPNADIWDWRDMPMDTRLWHEIDPVRFINKTRNEYSFKAYIDAMVPKHERLNGWHPSPTSHRAWAEYLYDYLAQHHLLPGTAA